MERVMKFIGAILLTALAVAALSTCVNPFDWVATVSDEVMQAKDLYLQVLSTTPTSSSLTANPWEAITIFFDRDIDMASVTSSSVVLSPAVDWTASFVPATHALSIKPSALNSETSYTVTVTKDLRGKDQSALREPYSWGFKTIFSPSGSVSISGTTYNEVKYTNSQNITVTISYNPVVTHYRISTTDPPVFDGAGNDYLGIVNPTPDNRTAPIVGYFDPLPAGEGLKKVYVQFRGSGIETPPEAVFDTVYLDQTPPTVDVGTFPSYLNSTAPSFVASPTAYDDKGGIKTYFWSDSVGTGDVTIADWTTANPTISAVTDGTRTVRLTVTDSAGNTAYSEKALTIDRVAPTAPNITSGPGSPYKGASPTFIWASTDGTGADFFRYRYDTTSSYSAETPSTTASPSVSPKYGQRSFYVQERDAAGNWSADSTAWSAFIYPDWILPEQEDTVDLTPTIRWATKVFGGPTFDVFYKENTDRFWTQFRNDTTSLSGTLPTLSKYSTYYWYYTVTVDRVTSRFPYPNGYFTFYTGILP